MQERRIHRIFEVSVLLKGAHALVECLSGLALAFASNGAILAFVDRLRESELLEDQHDLVASALLHFSRDFSAASQHFYAFYLLSHGVVKLALVVGLLKQKLWAYPASLAVLGLFIAYQLYRYSYTHGAVLIVLTIFDLFVMVLVWHEYRLLRRHLPVR
jgi:uncharacterized membrane protein